MNIEKYTKPKEEVNLYTTNFKLLMEELVQMGWQKGLSYKTVQLVHIESITFVHNYFFKGDKRIVIISQTNGKGEGRFNAFFAEANDKTKDILKKAKMI